MSVSESNNCVQGITGSVALVTGASSGLGAHFAQLLAGKGAHVVLAARRTDRLNELYQRIFDEGGQAMVSCMDVTCEHSVSDALGAIQDALGPVSLLINNAGMADSRSFLKLDEASWQNTLDVNLSGAWRVAHQVTRQMVESGRPGCILNIASILGLRVGFGHSAYAASKAALVQLTRSMALELAPKRIRVNALCPGFIQTEINAEYFATEQGQRYLDSTPAGRAGRLDELDGAVLLLCSDAGSFINGVALPVDGGHLLGTV